MTDKKELSNEELEDVNGGSDCNNDDLHYYEDNFKCEINKYDANKYIGEEVRVDNVVVQHGVGISYGGILMNSYEKTTSCGTERTHLISVKFVSNASYDSCVGKEIELSGDNHRVFVKQLH